MLFRSTGGVLDVSESAEPLRVGLLVVGVGAPQFGLRRTFLVTLSQKF